MSEELLAEFRRKVWITRKSRIEASERVLKKYNFYQAVQTYYSIFIVAYSVWNMQPSEGNSTASLFLLIVSLIFSLFSLYIGGKNLKDKYFNLKINYIEMDKIYGKLESIKFNESVEGIREHYNNLLSSVDNHETIDYYRVIVSDPEEKRKLSNEELLKITNYIKRNGIIEFITKAIFYLMPIIIPITCKFFLDGLDRLFS